MRTAGAPDGCGSSVHHRPIGVKRSVPTVTLRVVLAEDNYLLRAGTAALLGALNGVELVAATADKDELLAAVDEHRPDVVITDIRMPPDHQTEGLAAAA